MEKEKVVILAKKLYALKIQGVGGEAENAGRQLDNLMQKYDLVMSDLDIEVRTRRYFPAPKRGPVRDVIAQCIYSNLGEEIGVFNTYGGDLVADMTDSEYAKASYEVPIIIKAFKKHYAAQQKLAFQAFIHKNKLFYHGPRKEDEKPVKSLTPEEEEMLRNAMKNTERVNVNPALGSGR